MRSKLRSHPDTETHIELGTWFDERHKFACAAQEYQAAAKLNPKSGRIFRLLGSSLLAGGDGSGAEKALRESIRLEPRSAESHEKLAEILEKLGQPGNAAAEWQSSLKLNPKSIVALAGLAEHYLAQGNSSAAIELLRSAPRNDALAIDLARAYAQAGSLADAEKVLRHSLAENPASFPLTRALVGVLVDEHTLERTFQEPVELAERYATKHPNNIEAQRLYLQMLVAWVPSGAQAGDLARATPLARKLLALAPRDPYFLYVNGMLERQAGDYAAAKEHLEKSVAIDPADDRSHYELGMVLAALNDSVGAEREFRKTLDLGNNRPEVRFQLAKVLRTLGKTDESDQQMKRYRDQTAEASQQRVAALKEAQARQALSAGKNDEAVGLLRQAAQATPENALLQFKLALALDKTGDVASEQAALEKAIQIDPNLAMVENQLGYLASRNGDAKSAEEHFRRAVQVAPAYTEAWINLAATLGMEGKFSEAQQAVAEALRIDPKNTAASQLQQDLKTAQR